MSLLSLAAFSSFFRFRSSYLRGRRKGNGPVHETVSVLASAAQLAPFMRGNAQEAVLDDPLDDFRGRDHAMRRLHRAHDAPALRLLRIEIGAM